MGNASARRAKFLIEHPYCCFCGGKTPSEEEDHVPGRTFFREYQWPEGYVFPACSACNDATRYEEKVLSMLARVMIEDTNSTDQKEFLKLITDIAKNDPEFLRSFRNLSSNEARNFIRENGLEKPFGSTYADFPVMKFGPEVNIAARKYSRKILLALWYLHTGKILPKSGAMRISWTTNVSEAPADEDMNRLLTTLSNTPTLVRCRKLLDDQFVYRYAISTNREAAAFFVWFRESFGLLGFVTPERELLKGENLEFTF